MNERLFLALWPDVATRDRLVTLQASLPAGIGRRIAAENLHLTLLFFGNVDASQRGCIEAACDTVQARSVEIVLDAIHARAGTGLVWVRPNETPPALSFLMDQLRAALAGCWRPTDRRPFKAHVTLARAWHSRLPPAKRPTPVVWVARDFCLVASEPHAAGVRYTVRRRWALDES